MVARGRPLSVMTAAASGDQVKLLSALRARIAKEIQRSADLKPRDLATLTRQIRDINRELATLQPPKGDFVDAATQQAPGGRDDTDASF